MSEKENNMRVKCYRTLEEGLSEVERELNVRSRCFPRWIADGRVNRIDAQDRLDRLATAHLILSKLSQDALDEAERVTAAANMQVTSSGDTTLQKEGS